MSDLRQAAQQALEALETLLSTTEDVGRSIRYDTSKAITALRTALEQQAEPVAVYGYCPYCGAKGVTRERRPNGDDKCANGHTYPSRTATPVQPLLMNHNGAVLKVHGYPPQQQSEPVAWTLDSVPLGTKAPAFNGGAWTKTEHGWQWNSGSTFPRPGGDWDGRFILPTPPQQQAEPTTLPQRKLLTDFNARGILASKLTCWHRLTEEEANELVKLFIDHVLDANGIKEGT